MFRIYVSDTFWWTVSIAEPTDTGWKSQPLEVKYKNFSAEAFDAFIDDVRKNKLADGEVAERVVLDWRKVVDAAGAETPFSADALQQLCRTVKGAASCLVRDFIDCHTQAAAKN